MVGAVCPCTCSPRAFGWLGGEALRRQKRMLTNVDAQTAQRIRERSALQERRAKESKDAAAKERKRKREIEKARVSESDARMSEEKSKRRVERMMTARSGDSQRAVSLARRYLLAGPKFLGESPYGAKDSIKTQLVDPHTGKMHGGFDRDDTKMWFATDLCAVHRLVTLTKWHPYGIEPSGVATFVRILEEMNREEEQKAEAKSAAKASKTTSGKEKVMNALERSDAEKVVDMLKSRVPVTKEEADACHAYGITHKIIHASESWPDLGPSSGLSLEGRLLRWLTLQEDVVRGASENASIAFEEAFMTEKFSENRDRIVSEWAKRACGAT